VAVAVVVAVVAATSTVSIIAARFSSPRTRTRSWASHGSIRWAARSGLKLGLVVR
jgi:hypothetical protein